MGNPVVHFEVGCRDKDRTTAFYTELFDWTAAPYGPASAKLDTGSERGIQGHVTALGHEPHNYVMFYVEVADVPATIEQAQARGGKVLVGENPLPGGGTFAWLQDPEGNLFGIIQPAADG